jgi:hypothetical protein
MAQKPGSGIRIFSPLSTPPGHIASQVNRWWFIVKCSYDSPRHLCFLLSLLYFPTKFGLSWTPTITTATLLTCGFGLVFGLVSCPWGVSRFHFFRDGLYSQSLSDPSEITDFRFSPFAFLCLCVSRYHELSG